MRYEQAAADLVTTAIPPGVVRLVIAVVRETPVVRPVRVAAVAEDAVGRGMFLKLLHL